MANHKGDSQWILQDKEWRFRGGKKGYYVASLWTVVSTSKMNMSNREGKEDHSWLK